MEGAAFPRLTLDDHNLVATDYRFGVLLTTRQGPWEWKFGGYHLSTHISATNTCTSIPTWTGSITRVPAW